MKVLVMGNGDWEFQKCARSLARAILRQKLKILKIWHIKLSFWCQNFEFFKHLNAIARNKPCARTKKFQQWFGSDPRVIQHSLTNCPKITMLLTHLRAAH